MPTKKKTQDAKEAVGESTDGAHAAFPLHLPPRSIVAILADLSRQLPPECIATIPETTNQKTGRKRPAQDFLHWHTVNAILDTYAPGWEGAIVRIEKLGERIAVVYRLTLHAAEGSCSQDGDGMEDEDKDDYGDAMTSAVATAMKRAAAKFGVGRGLYDRDRKTAAFLTAARKDKEEAVKDLARVADAKGTPRKALLAWLCREAGVLRIGDLPVYLVKATTRELEGWPDAVREETHTETDADTGAAVRDGGIPQVDTTTGELLEPEDEERGAVAKLEKEIWDIYAESKVMFAHHGMHRAIVFHSFGVESPGKLKGQPRAILDKGMPLYRELTARVGMWDGIVKPDDWIRDQLRLMATHVPVPAAPHAPLTAAQRDEVDGLPWGLRSQEEDDALAAFAEREPEERPDEPGDGPEHPLGNPYR